MTDTTPALYKVIYSELVQATLREFVASATKAGQRDLFLAAVLELDRLLHLYPQFGEPLFNLKQEVGQVYSGTIPPLVVRYAVFEERRLVFVGAPPPIVVQRWFLNLMKTLPAARSSQKKKKACAAVAAIAENTTHQQVTPSISFACIAALVPW